MIRLSELTDIQSLQWSNAIRYGSAVLIGIVLVRGGLSLESVALYELLFFISNLFSYFWINGGKKAMLSIWDEEVHSSSPEFFKRMAILFTIAGVCSFALLLLSESLIVQFSSFKDLPYFKLIAVLTLFAIPASLVDYIYLLQKRFRFILIYSIITNGLALLSVLVPLAISGDLEMVLICLMVLAFLKFLWLIFTVFGTSPSGTSIPVSQGFLWVALPFVGHAALDGFMDYIDGFIVLKLFSDPNDFALFRYGAKELPLSMLLVSGVIAAMIPRLRQSEAEGLSDLKREHERLARWLYPFSILLMLLSPLLFEWVYGEVFIPSSIIFNVYLLVLCSRILMPQAILFSYKKGKVLFWIILIELVVNAGLSLLLAKVFGLAGIALATVIAFLLGKGLMIGYTWRILKIPPGLYTPIRSYLILNLFLVLSFFISYYLSSIL